MNCLTVKRLPFLSEEPLDSWRKCECRLKTWIHQESSSHSNMMAKFNEERIYECIWMTNYLEGTLPHSITTSKDDIISLLKHQDKEQTGINPAATTQILHHLEAFKLVISPESLKENLTEELIKKAHGIMMEGLSNEQGMKIHAGRYRTISVYAGNHTYPPHPWVSSEMMTIVENYNKKASIPGHDPYQLASWLFFNVVSLHPFEDGNGRISRLLWTYSLMKDQLPFLIVLTSGHKKSQKHLVQCIVKDRDQFYSDHPHVTSLTIHSVRLGWEQWDAFCANSN